jgi:methylenetetrahydrofolate reductase (NADPH)
MKFALRCGVGNSMRAVRSQIGRFGRLLTDTGPDDVVRGLRAAPAAATARVAGFHLFPFGGLRKTANWLREYDVRQPSNATTRPGASRDL